MTFVNSKKYAITPTGIAGDTSNHSIEMIPSLLLLQGAFTTLRLSETQESHEKSSDSTHTSKELWTQLKFSPDGKMISIGTNSTNLYLIEAFQGTPLHKFTVCRWRAEQVNGLPF
jgi:hypothetical protein